MVDPIQPLTANLNRLAVRLMMAIMAVAVCGLAFAGDPVYLPTQSPPAVYLPTVPPPPQAPPVRQTPVVISVAQLTSRPAPVPQRAVQAFRGHTHTCRVCGTRWDHTMNPGHNCPRCGRPEYVQDR